MYTPRNFGEGARGRRKAASAFLAYRPSVKPPRTSVYIDGFNLYYAVRETRFRWLNPRALAATVLPKNEIHRVRYFTALVQPRPGDSGQRQRQEVYLRALRTLPNLTIHLGTFLSHEVDAYRADSPPRRPRFVRIVKTEEKGSDVNLAAHLLMDGFRQDYEVAVVISNDSDLTEPIRMVRDELELTVGVLCPHDRPSRELLAAGTFFREIRASAFRRSQFPETLRDARGFFHRPPGWGSGTDAVASRRRTGRRETQ